MSDTRIAMLRQKLEATPEGVTPIPGAEALTVESSSGWRPRPLTPNDTPETPTILRVIGAGCLFYPGKTNMLQGETESGKSWIALAAAAEVLEAGGRVLWIDYEDTPRSFAGRLSAYLVHRDLWDRVDYLNPTTPLRAKDGVTHTAGHSDLAGLLRENTYALAVIDGLSIAMGIEGLEMNSANDTGAFYGRLPNVLAAHGAAVVMITHVTKNAETRGKYAIGSQAWNSNVSGAAYNVECRKPWSRAKGDQQVEGLIHVKVAKDRPGGVAPTGSTVSVVRVISSPDGVIDLQLRSPEDVVETPPIKLVRAIIDHVRIYPGATKSDIEDHVEGKALTVRAAKTWLVTQKVLTVDTSGRGHKHYLDEDEALRQGF